MIDRIGGLESGYYTDHKHSPASSSASSSSPPSGAGDGGGLPGGRGGRGAGLDPPGKVPDESRRADVLRKRGHCLHRIPAPRSEVIRGHPGLPVMAKDSVQCAYVSFYSICCGSYTGD